MNNNLNFYFKMKILNLTQMTSRRFDVKKKAIGKKVTLYIWENLYESIIWEITWLCHDFVSSFESFREMIFSWNILSSNTLVRIIVCHFVFQPSMAESSFFISDGYGKVKYINDCGEFLASFISDVYMKVILWYFKSYCFLFDPLLCITNN